MLNISKRELHYYPSTLDFNSFQKPMRSHLPDKSESSYLGRRQTNWGDYKADGLIPVRK